MLYAPVLGVDGVVAGHDRRRPLSRNAIAGRAAAVGGNDCLALLVLAGLAALPIGIDFLAATAAFCPVGADSGLGRWGAPRLPGWAVPLLGGLTGLALYGAGMAAGPPVIADDQFVSRGVGPGAAWRRAGASVAVIGDADGLRNTSAAPLGRSDLVGPT